MGKEICFHKIGPIMMPKRIGYEISTIFFYLHVTKIVGNLFLELVACDIPHADKYWIRQKIVLSGRKSNASAILYLFLSPTRQVDEDPIKNEVAIMSTIFSPTYKFMGDFC